MQQTYHHILEHLKQYHLMSLATCGDHPWIANVYYSFDEDLNLYFMSEPDTLHCQQLQKNNRVAVSIVAQNQPINHNKIGLQLWGTAQPITNWKKLDHVVRFLGQALTPSSELYTYKDQLVKFVKGQVYQVRPQKIKYFNERLYGFAGTTLEPPFMSQ